MTKLEQLKSVRNKIFTNKYPKKHIDFGGANLIVTDQIDRNFHDGDIVVYHPDAQSLSWLVYQLKSIFEDSIDAVNKYEFYGRIGELFLECLNCEMTVRETMIYTIGWADKWIADDEFPKIYNIKK